MNSGVKVLSVNCQGLRNKEKRNDVLNYLGSLQAGIICLQDTHWTDSDIRVIKQAWNGELYIKGEKSNSRGVAILTRGSLAKKKDNVFA